MRRKAFLAGLAISVGIALTSCGGSGSSTSSPKFDASVGTHNHGGSSPGVALVFTGTFENRTTYDGIPFRLKDPQGNVIYQTKVRFSAGYGFFWAARTSTPAQSGGYTLEADLPEGRTFSKTVQVDANQTLPRPDSVNLSATQNTATVTWTAVPGARSYYVDLWRVDGSGGLQTLVASWYTTDTSLNFSSLSLTQGEPYRARVFPFNFDFTKADAVLPSQFNTSSAISSAFSVSSLGTLQLLNIPDGNSADFGVHSR